jgi:hypothetical protein
VSGSRLTAILIGFRVVCLFGLFGLWAPAGIVPVADAQVPYLDPLPWFALPDSAAGQALLFHYDRFDDEKFNWTANRFGMTGVLPAGRQSCFFVRAHYLIFDTDKLAVLDRWPDAAGEDAEGWPGERRIVGWVRPEFGLLTHWSPPLLGRLKLGLSAALPVGRDELYPFTAASMPLRVNLRKVWQLSSAWGATLGTGYVQHLDSGRAFLDPAAFPSGQSTVAGLTWHHGSGASLDISWRQEFLDDRRTTRLAGHCWLPYRERHALGLIVQREMAGAVHRPYATLVGLVWRLNASGSQPTPP